ncbi:tropomyosin-1, isoforms 33/34-like [Penaeus japonicus]|uniref:tropomyosin-1, isoforms 33/34-like n=1 Tax=Penaeus japonicus TaxID=27405 RepID=UPI001C70BE37|nr:tropomyosin-1, isoforms 33/34-like [Penaeus japonicus]
MASVRASSRAQLLEQCALHLKESDVSVAAFLKYIDQFRASMMDLRKVDFSQLGEKTEPQPNVKEGKKTKRKDGKDSDSPVGKRFKADDKDSPMDQPIPAVEQAIPAAIPAAEQAIPAAEQAIPAAEQAIPAAEQAIPAAEQAIPAVEQAIPAAADPKAQKMAELQRLKDEKAAKAKMEKEEKKRQLEQQK